MRANRMFEQELSVLDEFQAEIPGEPEIKQAKEAYNLRWARDIVANSAANSGTSDNPTDDLQRKLQSKADWLSEDQLDNKDLVVKRAIEIAQGDPQLAYDLAIALHMMDFNSEAIEVLDCAVESPATDWLRLELMIRARQFVTALEEANNLELRYAGVPDSSFSVTYARARALYGLGQTETAIDLLKSIVRIRPHYKSAQSLLTEWNGDES
jgi:thioredoxin-like negative regulator of GroEL